MGAASSIVGVNASGGLGGGAIAVQAGGRKRKSVRACANKRRRRGGVHIPSSFQYGGRKMRSVRRRRS